MIELGANPKDKWIDGSTTVHAAAQNGHVAIVDRLVGLGVDPKEKAGGHVEMVGRLIELGDQNETANDGWTTVHKAAQHGNISVMNRLI